MLYVSNIVYYKRLGIGMHSQPWSMFNRWLRTHSSAIVSDDFSQWVKCWGLVAGNARYLKQCKNGSYRITGGTDNILALASFYELSVHAVASFAYNYFINFVLDNEK